MTLRGSKADNAIPTGAEVGRPDRKDDQRGVTITLFYVLSKWSK